MLQSALVATAVVLMQGHEARMSSIDAADSKALEYAAMVAAPGQVIFVEGSSWGHLPAEKTTMRSHYPSIGLVELNDSPSKNITAALLGGNLEILIRNEVAWAVTSIKGWSMSYIAENPQWELAADFNGARVWKLLTQQPPDPHSIIAPITDVTCEPNCEIRKHPWSTEMVTAPNGGNDIVYTQAGTVSFPIAISDDFQRRDVIVSLFILTSKGIDLTFNCQQGNLSVTKLHVMEESQWTRISISFPDVQVGQIEATLEVEQVSGFSKWINPLGSTGRSEAILDTQGLYVLFTEVRLGQ